MQAGVVGTQYLSQSKYIKIFINGNIYRRPSKIVKDITSFISDFTEAISCVNAMS